MTSATDLLPLIASANPLVHLFNGQHPWALGFGALLLGVSLFAWSVIASKTMGLRRSNRNDKIFLKHFRDSAHPLQVYGSNAKASGSVIHQVYTSGAEELTYHWLGSSEVDDTFEARMGRAAAMSKREIALFRTRLRRIADECRQGLESRMLLVTCLVNSLPLLGLLATAWGLMTAFSPGDAGNPQPSIGTSISLTVLALLIAIPASIGARLLREKLHLKSREVRHFCKELDASISTAYLTGNAANQDKVANHVAVPVNKNPFRDPHTDRVMKEAFESGVVHPEQAAVHQPVAPSQVAVAAADATEQIEFDAELAINPVARQTAQQAPCLLFEPHV